MAAYRFRASEASFALAAGRGETTRPSEIEFRTRSTTPRNYEVKWAGPDGVVLDVSESGWAGASE